jgi:hypothetical protein
MSSLSFLRIASLTTTLFATFAIPHVPAQARRPVAGKPDDVRTLESKTQEAQTAYLAQLADLAKGYEAAGDVEKAQESLRQILRVSPDNQAVRDKLKELGDKVFDENQRGIEVDSSKGWMTTGLKVKKGEPIRVIAEGTYKFIVNADLGPAGFPAADVMRDMADNVPAGGLMATIVPEPNPRNRQPKPIKPFAVGGDGEVRPEEDGLLLLRLNVPPGSKCIGKVRVKVSGNITAASGS